MSDYDAEAERERMIELLREKGPEHLQALRDERERKLSEVKKQLETTRQKVVEEVEHIVKNYGSETTPEERREAAQRVDLFREAMRRLKERAEEAEDERRRTIYIGRYRHALNLVEVLYRRLDRRDDRERRLRVVQRVLGAWTDGELDEDGEQPVEDHADVEADGDQSEFRGDKYAEWVGDHIDRATSLSHAYALALASGPKAFDPDKVEQYRGKEYKSDREVVRQAWRRSGYLDTGPYTPQKLKRLKRRVKRYASEGIPPQRPEN